MAHGPEDIALYFFIRAVKLLQESLHFFAFGIVGAWACVNKLRKFLISGKFSNQLFICKCQWSNNRKLLLKKCLGRHHSADLTGITYIHKKRFYDIIFVVTKGQFGAAEFIGYFKQAFSAQPGAKETRVFTIFGAVSHQPVVGVFGSD